MKYLKIYEDFNNINPNMETNRLKRVTPKQINDLKSNEVKLMLYPLKTIEKI